MIWQIISILVAASLLVFTVWVEYRKRRSRRLIGTNCYHNEGYPVIGVLPQLWKVRTVKDIFEFIMSMVDEDTIGSTWIAHKQYITVHDPFIVEKVMACPDAIEKTDEYKAMGILVDGLFIAGKERWRVMRKAMNRTFTTDLLDSYLDYAIGLSKICTRVITKEHNNQYIDVRPYMARYFLDLILNTHYGMNTNEQEENKFDVIDPMTTLLDMALWERILKPYYHYDFIYKRTALYQRSIPLTKRFYRPIEESAKMRFPDWKIRKEENGGVPVNYVMMDYYFQLVDDLNLTQELETYNKLASDILIAGTDTTSYATSSLMYFLAINKDLQDRLYQEVMEHFPKSGNLTKESLDKMTYLDMCSHEAMRLVSPPGVLRTLSKDLRVGKECVLPRGSNIYIIIQKLHNDPKYWERPKSFYPEHFSPEAVAKRPKMSFIPFSAGPRKCPGGRYGMQAMKSVVAHLLREYEFETNLAYDKIEYQVHLMQEFVQGYPIKFVRRAK